LEENSEMNELFDEMRPQDEMWYAYVAERLVIIIKTFFSYKKIGWSKLLLFTNIQEGESMFFDWNLWKASRNRVNLSMKMC
jgi:hypothetical protein